MNNRDPPQILNIYIYFTVTSIVRYSISNDFHTVSHCVKKGMGIYTMAEAIPFGSLDEKFAPAAGFRGANCSPRLCATLAFLNNSEPHSTGVQHSLYNPISVRTRTLLRSGLIIWGWIFLNIGTIASWTQGQARSSTFAKNNFTVSCSTAVIWLKFLNSSGEIWIVNVIIFCSFDQG